MRERQLPSLLREGAPDISADVVKFRARLFCAITSNASDLSRIARKSSMKDAGEHILYRAKGTHAFKGWEYAVQFFTLSVDFVRERSMHELYESMPSHGHGWAPVANRVVEFFDKEVYDMHGFPLPSFVVFEWQDGILAKYAPRDVLQRTALQVCMLNCISCATSCSAIIFQQSHSLMLVCT
jgi:hypothetical protein